MASIVRAISFSATCPIEILHMLITLWLQCGFIVHIANRRMKALSRITHCPYQCELSAGSDLHAISMGQGQEVHARRFMALALANGDWVLLQNCHLSLDYVVEVMEQVNETEVVHDSFRLWVTTEVHPKFPITFLQVRSLSAVSGECDKSYFLFYLVLLTLRDRRWLCLYNMGRFVYFF